jgi:metal-responsive CopG/Arc/MetJ family transcriptional regulator
MAMVKTAISLQKQLFESAEELARSMKVSRSRLFVLALQDYIERRQNRRLLDRLNAVYAGDQDLNEGGVRRKMRRTHRRHTEGEW